MSSTKTKHYFSTQFGNATFFSGLNPSEAISIKKELDLARKGLVLKGNLHLCYLVTPIQYVSIEPDWAFFYQIFNSLSPIFAKTANRLGISEFYLSRCAYNPPSYQCMSPEAISHRRFFLALMLSEIINEKSLSEISARFGAERGQLQALQNSAAAMAATLALFCERLRWPVMASLLAHFCERINFGVQGELLPLLQIPHVKAFRARALFDSGFTTIEAVAEASKAQIKEAISRYQCFSAPDSKEGLLKERIERRTTELIQKEANALISQRLENMQGEFEETTELEKLDEQLQNHRMRETGKDFEMEEIDSIFDY
ncbi:hypothetical protein MHBO_000991 [Bonamia ostreae]